MSELKLIKITNPMWMQVLGPRISDYCKLLDSPCVTYESMTTYMTAIVQFGGDAAEFWVAFDGGNPVGFCLWTILGPPNIGVVHCDQLYVWEKNPEISRSLFRKFLEFAESKRAPYIHGLLVNQKVADHFAEIGISENMAPIVSERVELYGRRN